MHTEILVGKTQRPAVCVLCSKPIEIGQICAYARQTPPHEPKGSRHLDCHLKRARS